MHPIIEERFTKVNPQTRIGKIIQFPITRIFVAISIVYLFPGIFLTGFIKSDLIQSLDEPFLTILEFAYDLLFLILLMILYHVYTRYIERRKALELSLRNFHKELGIGFLIAAGAVCFMVILMLVAGYYQIDGINGYSYLFDSFRRHLMVSFSEELLFRLIIFKLIEEYSGSWIALIVQGVIFSFAHLGNPNATVLISLGSVVDTTLLLGGAYMLTRRIWLVMGIHWSWNFFQTGVFGMPCSGVTKPGFIQAIIEGPEWFTGGAFGIEASYASIFINFLIGLYILKLVIKKDLIVPSIWKRKRNEN